MEVVRERRRAKSVVGVTQEERSAGIREVALCACILDNGILVFIVASCSFRHSVLSVILWNIDVLDNRSVY